MISALTPVRGSATANLADGGALRARIPADVDAPDRLAFDLTLRQIALLAAAAVLAAGLWSALTPLVPVAARIAALVPIAGAGLALAAGRRDGLPLDAWVTAAAIFKRRPHRLTPAPIEALPEWAPTPAGPPSNRSGRPPSLLRLPAEAVDADGTIRHGGAATILVATTTVNIALRTPGEQAGLVAGFGRWLNGLTSPVQVVVSTRRVDLAGHATRLIDQAQRLRDPGLASAAADHAEFLLDLAEDRDPLARTVTIATTATGGPAPDVAARRAAEHTAGSLTALGADTVILDGPGATAVLTSATDPYQAGDSGWARTPPGTILTAGHARGVEQSEAFR